MKSKSRIDKGESAESGDDMIDLQTFTVNCRLMKSFLSKRWRINYFDTDRSKYVRSAWARCA